MFGDRSDVYLPTQPLEVQNSVGLPIILSANTIFHSSLYGKALWETVGGYDEKMTLGYEDWEFWIRLAKAGAEFHLIEEPLYEYRIRVGSMTSSAERNHGRIVSYMASKHPEMMLG